MFYGDLCFYGLARVVFGHARRQDQVNPEGLFSHQFFDLSELFLDFMGKPSCSAIDAIASRICDCGDNVYIVCKTEDRILDS